MGIKVLTEISARHVHVTDEDLEKLFGAGHKLTIKKELSQPGQYACEEKVTIVGPRGEMKASILGPTRKQTQVEISLTEARTLGLEAMVRESGHLDGTKGCKLVGPAGEIEIPCGVIAAKRHVHLDPKTADELGVSNGESIYLKVDSPDRSLIFGDLVVRINEKFVPAVHLDTDEANACGIKGSVEGELLKTL